MLADRYRQVRRIASGGMGTVYEGVDERLGRRVAIKLLKEEYAANPLFVERFGREARAAASLDHPNIAQIFDSGQHGGQHFLVMEFLEGGRSRPYAARRRPAPRRCCRQRDGAGVLGAGRRAHGRNRAR
jgi:eukaryotic-like serine/threonine-protein kinase